ncbi:MAG: PaaI family thioesterase [SAR324 cluster bacterium]|nr:PaaI family thioesterase [SAR324 cluster bacterium]MCZ6556169.1 PaaI family thioesterase [SAR324 cluster bacterium]
MSTIEEMQDRMRGLLPGLLGIRLLEATQERVRAELLVREDLCTLPGILHGGAVMALADTLGGLATWLNLPEGKGTTTIESKTNFFAHGVTGGKVIAECTPLHRGRSTMVWQTRLTLESGKLLALVTQTQLVLNPPDG